VHLVGFILIITVADVYSLRTKMCIISHAPSRKRQIIVRLAGDSVSVQSAVCNFTSSFLCLEFGYGS